MKSGAVEYVHLGSIFGDGAPAVENEVVNAVVGRGGPAG